MIHSKTYIRGIDYYPEGTRVEFYEEGRLVAWLTLDESLVALGQAVVGAWNIAFAAFYGDTIEVWQYVPAELSDWMGSETSSTPPTRH